MGAGVGSRRRGDNVTPERFDELRANAESDTSLISVTDVSECLEEIARLAKMVYVPGAWYCPKCKFQLVTSILYAASGNIGVDRKTPDPCPNDGTPMLPQTWETDAKSMSESMPDAVAMEMIHDLRRDEGDSITVLCDNLDADDEDHQCAVIACGLWTSWTDRRFNGRDVRDALSKARSALRAATKE